MSERLRAAIREGNREEALRAAEAMIRAGQAAALANAVVELLVTESAWIREGTLALLCLVQPHDDLLDSLTRELASADHPERRNAARSALATLATPGAIDPAAPLPRLLTRLADDPDVDVRILAANSLGEARNPRAREALERALADPAPNVVAAAAEALGELNDPRAVDALVTLAERRDFWTGNAAVMALGELGDARAVPSLASLTSDPWLAAEAARAMGKIGNAAALQPLHDMIEMPAEPRREAIRAAAAIVLATGEAPPGWLRRALSAEEEALLREFADTRELEAARLLGLAGTHRAAEALLDDLFSDPDGAGAVGLAQVPAEVRSGVLEARLASADAETLPSLLTLLPPLRHVGEIQEVARLLVHERGEVHAAAAEALSRSDPDQVLPVLEALRRDPAARLGVALAYSRMGSSRCTPLLEMLRDPDARVRAAAAEGAGRCGLATVQELREAFGRESDPSVARALVRSIGNAGGDEAVTELVSVMKSSDAALRFEAVRALGCTGSPAAFRPLVDALTDSDPGIRTVALSALGDLGDARAAEPLSRHIDDPDRDRRRIAAAALDRLYGAESSSLLEGALRDPDREVRLVAVTAVGRLRLAGALATLERVAEEDWDPLVRHAAATVAAGLQDPAHERP